MSKLQKLDPEEAGRGELPVYRDIAGEVGATAQYPLHRRRQAALDRVARRVRRLQQRRASSTFSSRKAISSRCRISPRRTRATCCLASGTASSPRPVTRRGSLANRKGRGALLIAGFQSRRLVSTFLQINRGSNLCRCSAIWAQKNGDGPPAANGQLDGNQAGRTEPQPRCCRGQDFGENRDPRPDPRQSQVGGGDASGHAGSMKPKTATQWIRYVVMAAIALVLVWMMLRIYVL